MRRGYDAGFRYMGRDDRYGRYDSDTRGPRWGAASGWGAGQGWGGGQYGPGYADYRYGPQGYEGGGKSRWEIENGDPFGDRGAHTPMRMTHGPYRSGYGADYDRGYASGPRRGYGRDYYAANPMGYEPYRGRWDSENARIRRGRYDTGWF